jgi:nucleoside-diphosphate-sugar epimerase
VLKRDLDHILLQVKKEVWAEIKGARLFVTGGTGFFGRWLLECLSAANSTLNLKMSVTVLTRSRDKFLALAPHLSSERGFEYVQGDVQTLVHDSQAFSHMLHMATPATEAANIERPFETLDTIVGGTRNALEFALQSNVSRFLYASSGAVYGPQNPSISHIEEGHLTGPDTTSIRSSYAEGKRVAEHMCVLASANQTIETVIARCFAFGGPYLPLDSHFAFGNFVANAQRGETIVVSGDGTPLRSYMYPADLVVWLLTLLTQGQSGRAYNVGSDQEISIGDLAKKVSQSFGVPYEIRGQAGIKAGLPSRYVPSIHRAKSELGLKVAIGLDQAIDNTKEFLRGLNT